MRTLGFDKDAPDFFAEMMASTAVDKDIITEWNKANPAQRQSMMTEIVSYEVKDCFNRRLAGTNDLTARLKEHLQS